MIRIIQRCWLSFSLLLFGVLLLGLTVELGPTAQLIPGKVIIVTLALLSIQFVFDLVPKLSDSIAKFAQLRIRSVEQLGAKAREQSTKNNIDEQIGNKHKWNDFLWFCSAPMSIYLVGFTIAAPLYTLLFLKWRSGEKWLLSALLAIGMGGFVFGVFYLILDVSFDQGQIWHWLSA